MNVGWMAGKETIMAFEGILDVAEVAKLLGISSTAVHRLAARGTLSSEWIAGKRVWRRSTIDRYLADAEAQARRRGGSGQGKLFVGREEVDKDDFLHMIEGQAPAGWDPKGSRRGGPR